MSAAVVAAANQLSDDASFLAAEQSLAELRQQIAAAADKVASIAEEKAFVKPLDDKMWEFYDAIMSSPPVSIASAIIKLRLLADPNIGIENGGQPEDAEAVRQVLAFLETQAGAGLPMAIGFGEPEERS
jgi:hypothetical protein